MLLILLQGRWPSHFIYAKAALPKGTPTPTAVQPSHRPELDTVSRPGLVVAAREAADADYVVQVACASDYVAHATEFSKLGRIPVLKARTNADLRIAGAAVDRWSRSSDCHFNMKPDACNSG